MDINEKLFGTAPHTHAVASTRTEPFSEPIEGGGNVRSAHGNVTEIDTCACGATRRANVNGRHVEQGPWRAAAPE